MRSVAEVEAILARMAACRVLVVGDQMLDEYLHGEIGRISPEAPVPVMHLQRSESRLGGASNVARNVAALGAHVSVFGVVGADRAGEALCGHLDELNRSNRAGGLQQASDDPKNSVNVHRAQSAGVSFR